MIRMVFLVLTALVLELPALAAQLNLKCNVSDELFRKSTSLQAVEVIDMLGKETKSNLPDALLMERLEDDKKWIAYFSNECDNFYGLSVDRKAVEQALETGRAEAEIHIEYFNANIEVPDDAYENATGNCVITRVDN